VLSLVGRGIVDRRDAFFAGDRANLRTIRASAMDYAPAPSSVGTKLARDTVLARRAREGERAGASYALRISVSLDDTRCMAVPPRAQLGASSTTKAYGMPSCWGSFPRLDGKSLASTASATTCGLRLLSSIAAVSSPSTSIAPTCRRVVPAGGKTCTPCPLGGPGRFPCVGVAYARRASRSVERKGICERCSVPLSRRSRARPRRAASRGVAGRSRRGRSLACIACARRRRGRGRAGRGRT
jgi:hypothetical protein